MEAEKRNLSSSSLVESSPKREKREEETEPPAWARSLIADVAKTVNNTNDIKITVSDLKNDLRNMQEEVEAMDVRLKRLELRDEAREEEVAALKAENVALRAANNKLQDDSLRDSLSIHHIPRKQGRESWADTKQILSKWLAQNSGVSEEELTRKEEEWARKISRAHRGKPTSTVIHCLFKDWEYAQEVKELFRAKKGKIGLVFCLDKFSVDTQERRNRAQTRRDEERRRVPNSKLYIRYPATLMCQRPGEQGYQPIATF